MNDDKYLYLEEVESETSLHWVRDQNKRTLDSFKSHEGFQYLENGLLKIFESKDKITYPDEIDKDYVYNFWNDEVFVQGVLRRAKIQTFLDNKPDWEIVFNLDELSKAESQKWVYQGISIRDDSKRALVYLSPGGKDANVIREFDLVKKSFEIENGFNLPISKGSSGWIDNDTIILKRIFSQEDMTTSGYPKNIHILKRGETVENAQLIFSGLDTDVSVLNLNLKNYLKQSQIVLARRINFYEYSYFKLVNNQIEQCELPCKAVFYGGSYERSFFQIKEGYKDFLSGDVVSYDFETNEMRLVFQAPANGSIYDISASEKGVYIVVNVDVISKLYYFNFIDNNWIKHEIKTPDLVSNTFLLTDKMSERYFYACSTFNVPVSLFYGNEDETPKLIRSCPVYFNYKDIIVKQYFATSTDGVQIPYFVAHHKDIVYDGKNPTIQYGYGGFEISQTPSFLNILGFAWLEKGGVYILSNIRGGGEYGPRWHQAGLKNKRQIIYDDFFAIAEDLFKRGITSPQHLGAMGGSNGGLLMGVAFTQRPDLYKAIVCGVPLLDMRRYHLLLAGASWMAEYGNPELPEGEYINKVSPYHNLKSHQNYPNIFLHTSTKDDRVHPGHARKFAAKLLELGYSLSYYENIDGGHAGASNLKESAHKSAMIYTFFDQNLKRS